MYPPYLMKKKSLILQRLYNKAGKKIARICKLNLVKGEEEDLPLYNNQLSENARKK